jgi:hypothetical protein
LALLLSDDHESTVLIVNLKVDMKTGKGKDKGSNRSAVPEFIQLKVECEKPFPEVLNKVTFNPKNDTELCTSGVNHWKVWRLNPEG